MSIQPLFWSKIDLRKNDDRFIGVLRFTVWKRTDIIPMVTYSELIEFSMFIVTLIGLCYAIFKGRK